MPVERDTEPIIGLFGGFWETFPDEGSQALHHYPFLPGQFQHGLVHDFRARNERFGFLASFFHSREPTPGV